MAAPTTTNVKLHPQDGWVLLSATAATLFIRLSKNVHHLPVYLAWGTVPPTTAGAGYRWECETVHFDGATTGNMYGKIANNSNADVTVSVFVN